MPSTLNIEWLNRNSQRAYPFQEDMQRRPVIDGVAVSEYRIPNGAILDMAMATNFETQPSVYLSALTLTGSIATAVISDVSDGTVLAVASCSQQPDDDHTPVNFTGSGKHDDIRGTIVFGSLRKVAESIPDGIYRFEPAETTFEARCVRPSVPCVSGLYVTTTYGSFESKRLRGDVAFVAGENVRLDFDEDNNAIVIHADANYNFNEKCGCELTDKRGEVLTINGISADDIVIEGDGSCVDVQTSEGRVKIVDTCSKPCCGCAELTFLNQKTNMITTSISRLDSFSKDLDSRLTDFIRNVLLSDRSSMKYV